MLFSVFLCVCTTLEANLAIIFCHWRFCLCSVLAIVLQLFSITKYERFLTTSILWCTSPPPSSSLHDVMDSYSNDGTTPPMNNCGASRRRLLENIATTSQYWKIYEPNLSRLRLFQFFKFLQYCSQAPTPSFSDKFTWLNMALVYALLHPLLRLCGLVISIYFCNLMLILMCVCVVGLCHLQLWAELSILKWLEFLIWKYLEKCNTVKYTTDPLS